MAEPARADLSGRRILVVEDEYAIAADLALLLEDAGAEVAGPAGSVDDALELVEEEGDRLDGALLDINLRDERVYPVADALSARGVPFIFTTGYDPGAILAAHADAPRHEKPVDRARLLREVAARFASRAG